MTFQVWFTVQTNRSHVKLPSGAIGSMGVEGYLCMYPTLSIHLTCSRQHLQKHLKVHQRMKKVYICGWTGHVCSLLRVPNHCDVCMYWCYVVYHFGKNSTCTKMIASVYFVLSAYKGQPLIGWVHTKAQSHFSPDHSALYPHCFVCLPLGVGCSDYYMDTGVEWSLNRPRYKDSFRGTLQMNGLWDIFWSFKSMATKCK